MSKINDDEERAFSVTAELFVNVNVIISSV